MTARVIPRRGIAVLSGHGAPASDLGYAGDIYIDVDAERIYGPKVAGGIWGSGVTMVGPTGPTGPTGPEGPAHVHHIEHQIGGTDQIDLALLGAAERDEIASSLPNFSRAFRSNRATTVISVFGDSTSLRTNAGALWARLLFHTAPGELLEGLLSTNIKGDGNNGQSLAGWITNTPGTGYTFSELVADNPSLVVLSMGINDVRLGNTTQAQLRALLITAVEMILAALPNCDVVLRIPNSLLADDPTSTGFISPISSAQTYTDIMRNAYLSLINYWPNVVVMDAQSQIFGRTSPTTANTQLMSDPLHPATLGYRRVADLIAATIGFAIPFAKEFALSAINLNPTAPWTIYGRACEHPGFFDLVWKGEYVGQTSTSITIAPDQDSRTTGANFGEASANDICELPGGVTFRLPSTTNSASVASGDLSRPNIQLNTLGSSIPTNTVTAGTVRVWREVGNGDSFIASLVRMARTSTPGNPGGYQTIKVGRIASATSTIVTVTTDPLTRGRRDSGQWAINATDTMYVAGFGPGTAIALTGVTAQLSGANLQMTSFPSDLSSYVGRQCVIVSATQHAPETTGDHARLVSVAIGTVGAGAVVEIAVTFTGMAFNAKTPTAVVAQPRAAIPTGLMQGAARVSAADTVIIPFINPTASPIVGGTINYDLFGIH